MADKNSWLEVALEVNGELAEAVAEVLARFAPNGVVIESTQIEAGPEEFGRATGPLRVVAYLPIDETLEDKRQKLEESLYFLGLIQPLPEASYTMIQDKNWMESWKKHFKPLRVGKNLLILPDWIENPEPDRIAIKIDPGMAFGTGTHPTTQISLSFIEEYLKPGNELFDIGSGSGILSIAGIKLGAKAAYGVDVESPAKEIAFQNAEINEIRKGLHFEIGSIEVIRSGAFPIQQAPVVVANILSHILVKLFDQGMADLIAPNGVILLSGILTEMEDKILKALDRQGLSVDKRVQMEDWVGLAAKKE